MMEGVATRLSRGVIAAVPVPFSGTSINEAAQRRYAESMQQESLAGVAVWAHTGRGPHLSPEQRRTVLETWRELLPDKVIVAGAHDIGSAIDARRRSADALLIHPVADDPLRHHDRLSRELPGIVFWLYQAAGGVAYDDATLHALLDLPHIIGIKIATLDSVMTFQRLVQLVRQHPGKLIITGEDRFLGYSIIAGADAALIGMAAAVPALSAELFNAEGAGDHARFLALTRAADAFAGETFCQPMEGYIQRMLWAAAAEGRLPADACDDPWGPRLDAGQRNRVVQAVRDAQSALG
ncbi:MAG TPA: dihydrodipicolinate synthase family protein [Gemmatimonadales bacterium]|nr:dihydrodipicolinate synthase family protein [Gemmatimonadales bacterium]